MSETLNKLRKKRGSPVEINGDTFHVRGLTRGELRRAAELEADTKPAFLVGCALYADGGEQPEFPKQPEESDQDWAKRIAVELDDVPEEKVIAIITGVSNLSKVPKTADIIKN